MSRNARKRAFQRWTVTFICLIVTMYYFEFDQWMHVNYIDTTTNDLHADVNHVITYNVTSNNSLSHRKHPLYIQDPDKIITILCGIAKDEERYIEEWIYYHLLMGFDRVYIYDNSDNATLVKYFMKNNKTFRFPISKINITHFPGIKQQVLAYNFCLNYIRHELRKSAILRTWMAFIDIDEFIVLKQDNDIKTFLYRYERNFNTLSLSRYQFGSNGQKHYVKNGVLEAFTRRELISSGGAKSIVRLKYAVRMTNPHFPLMWRHGNIIVGGNESRILHVNYDGNDSNILWGNVDQLSDAQRIHNLFNCKIACINHYFLKSMEYWNITKIKKGKAHSIRIKHSMEQWINSNKIYNQNVDTFARDWFRNKSQTNMENKQSKFFIAK